MKNFLLLIFGALLIFTACTRAGTDDLKVAEVDFRVEQVLLRSGGELGDQLEFDVYLERPDLGLKEPAQSGQDLLTVDLPLGIQPKLMYLSAIDDTDPGNGSMCDRPRFPHRCTVNLSEEEAKKNVHTFLLKTTFEDGAYIAKEITVTSPVALEKPEILMPTAAPIQGTAFEIQFKDVGADKYIILANLCRPYNYDGINPCLDGVEYILEKDDEKWKIIVGGELFTPILEEKEGLIMLKSDFPVYFEDSVGYTVIAARRLKTEDGINLYSETSDLKSFSN